MKKSKLSKATSPRKVTIATSEDSSNGTVAMPNNRFRSRILGVSAIAEQNAATFSEREETSGGASPTDRVTNEMMDRLENELERRQESYIRRERQYKVRIAELEAQLSESRSKKSKESSIDSTMDKLRQMHRSIIDSVGQVQDRTSQILQEQEKDLLRAFRARLYSVQEELESEKHKTDDGASAWIEKSKQLETEVEWTKELADRLDRLNQSLTRENQRLKMQFTTQENDREFLVKQLVNVKKENVRLRSEMDDVRKQMEDLRMDKDAQQQQQQQNGSGGAGTLGTSGTGVGTSNSLLLHGSVSSSVLPRMSFRDGGASLTAMNAASHIGIRPSTSSSVGNLPESDNRYKEIIKRLKRLLEVERRNLQQVRQLYQSELDSHNELEVIIKQCLQDVRHEIQQQSVSALEKHDGGEQKSSRGTSGPATSPLGHTASFNTELTLQDRQRLIDKLLSKERILDVLVAKAFPVKSKTRLLNHDQRASEPSPTAEEIAKLYAELATQRQSNGAGGGGGGL